MNGASKILTVSYGTFSCTLEGFDEPFNTMKAIAEYFRDLAADDRYFGAEPPTPDAAMLHKIAERKIQRRVEAKIQDNGVILRADDQAPPRVIMPAQLQPVQPRPAAAAPAAPILASVAEAAPAVESAAARLSRLRAAQAQILTTAPVLPTLGDISNRFSDVAAYAEDQDAEVATVPMPAFQVQTSVVPEPASAALPHVVIEDPVQTVPEEPAAAAAPADPTANLIETLVQDAPKAEPVSLAALAAEVETDIPLAADAEEDVVEPSALPDDLIAAFDAPEEAPEEATSAAPAPEAADDTMSSLRETLAGLMAQDDQLIADMTPADEAPLTASDDPLPEDAAGYAPEAEVLFDMPAETVDDADLQDLAKLDAATPLIDDAALIEAEVVEVAPVAAPEAEAEPAEAPVAEAAPVADEPAADRPASIEASPEAPIVADKIQRARARVIKIRRLDKKAAPESPAEARQPAAIPAPVAQPDTAALSPEAEADLQNALAALEAEIAPATVVETQDQSVEAILDAEMDAEPAPANVVTDVEPEAAAEIADEAPMVAEVAPADKAAESKMSDVVTDDAAVDRLLAQTNTQFEVPEVKRRRSAIAHLKAAVLATVADRRSNPNAKSNVAEVKLDPYRKDLNRAVRPAGAPADRPAPLVLVSAQRIDIKRDAVADAARPVPQIVPSVPAPAQPAAPMPVRPRRVTSGGMAQAVSDLSPEDEDPNLTPEALDNIFADGSRQSFSDFAESLGADTMAELIEAAGAYCTLVLERPSFTRPLLFQQISTIPQMSDMKREESLRGFGKLLRDGRIQKTVRGQFALSATSPILTEAKRIAG